MKKAEWVGNPLRAEFLRQGAPADRFAGRSGPLRLLVVGGSLGAKALNDTVPLALALLPEDQRPVVIHQSGEKQIDALRAKLRRRRCAGRAQRPSSTTPPRRLPRPT